MHRVLALFLAATLALPLVADELVLVPIWYNGRGAEGSNWTTHFSAFNSGSGYTEPNDRGILPCQWLANPCPRGFFQDKMIVYPAVQSMPGGFVMAVPNANQLHFSLRVFEESAWRDDLGVDIPVVRERDLKSGNVQLMDVPRSDIELFRYTLRVYGIGAATTAAVRLNGYVTMADGTPDLVMTKEVQLELIPHGLGHYYAEDTTFIRDLVFAVGQMGQIRVEIEPRTQNMRWWALASSTNKRTQDVTIVTPQ
ncbi:MAG TPA: hypothetical protein VE974_20735 [Thermoanaerobaculia bacterium]|nr:hypothetical protein [Thermoanaerobaculia bacterium]